MGVKFEGKSYAGNMPVFWRGEAKILPGGYKLLQTFPKGTVIPKGTPLHIVIGTLTAAVSKYAKVVSGGTTTKPRVPKGTLFQINDIVMKEGETTGVTVSSIDTSNADYDVLKRRLQVVLRPSMNQTRLLVKTLNLCPAVIKTLFRLRMTQLSFWDIQCNYPLHGCRVSV